MKWKFVIGLLLLSLVLFGIHTASARPNYMAAFVEQYDLTDTRLATCDTCHVNPNGGGIRDSYGISYSENGKDFLAIEELDSDGDGFTNIEEINALTFPGHSDDYPEVTEITERETETEDHENEINTTVTTEDAIQTGSDSDVENTTTDVQSPGFGIVLAVLGFLAALYVKR
ncbi:PGF-CTERM sorting domain-containing protein [Methanolobus bombayensis]|uniref:PGF-CTERM sorting domain-containing protein n=1 Tax=Methanolobus bombayensis TaxID=38023 RepID=UPI001AE8F5D0|nr:PGF-CTERM sorting domain-containing protein [Methanolobus bombayensis]MBP1908470.1 hypothetical protein [Methanolobus bombayensis]